MITGSVVSDAEVGDVYTETEYKNPSYGILDEIIVDPNGLAVKNSTTTEARNLGFLRQLSSTSNAGTTSQYAYWGATETADNPCTSQVEAHKQAGRLKSTINVDPDGAGSEVALVTETIYDDTGRIVADRIGSDPWTCITFDSRGRLTEVDIPSVGNRSGRTVTYDHSYSSNPLSARVTDLNGSTATTVDLLGRTTEFVDALNNSTQFFYTDVGQIHERTSSLGYELLTYDSYGRLLKYDLDSTTLAEMSYDSYGRVTEVEYPSIKDPNTNQTLTMDTFTRDSLERLTGFQYTLPDNSQISNAVSLSQSGIVLDESVNGVDLSPGVNGFEYDKAGRLTKANVAGHTYEYGFGQPNSACSNYSTSFDGAGDNYNRTSYKIDGAAEWYCYDSADKLIGSSEARFDAPTYDSHGNTLTLGSSGNLTTFTYDQSDRNLSIEEGSNKVEYMRDHDNRIIKRDVTTGGSTETYYYGSTGGNYNFMYKDSTNKTILEKYITLPGGVSLTVRPQESQNADKQKASLRNLHGDTLSTLNKEGVDETGILLYEPFGTEISATSSFEAANSGVSFAQATAAVDNADGNLEGRWAVSYDMNVEALFSVKPVQMGERVYIPGLGRFIQVDPQEGGTPNDYVYVLDPVNSSDYTGRGFFIPLVILAIRVAPKVMQLVSAIALVAKNSKVVSKLTSAANTVSKAVSNVARSVYNGVKSKFSSTAGKTSKGSTPSKPQVTPPKKGYTPRNPATLNRNYSTYVLKDSSNAVKYVGITSRGSSVRYAEHLRDPSKVGLRLQEAGSGMSKYQARVWEQQQINAYGLQKNGGALLNRINSISPNKWSAYGL